jgi:hypothetical protein
MTLMSSHCSGTRAAERWKSLLGREGGGAFVEFGSCCLVLLLAPEPPGVPSPVPSSGAPRRPLFLRLGPRSARPSCAAGSFFFFLEAGGREPLCYYTF